MNLAGTGNHCDLEAALTGYPMMINRDEWCFLMFMTINYSHPECMRVLLSHGADPNSVYKGRVNSVYKGRVNSVGCTKRVVRQVMEHAAIFLTHLKEEKGVFYRIHQE